MRRIAPVLRPVVLSFWMVSVSAFAATGPAVIQVGPARYPASMAEGPRSAAISDLAFAAPRLRESERHRLGPLTAAERADLITDDRGELLRKRSSLKIGIIREVPDVIEFHGIALLDAGEHRSVGGGLLERDGEGRMVWTTSITSEGAGALRLEFAAVRLPQGSRVFIYSGAGEVHGPYTFDGVAGEEGFWTNTIFSDEVFVEIRFPELTADTASAATFAIRRIGHLEHPAFAPRSEPEAEGIVPAGTECFVNATCVDSSQFARIDDASKSVAQLTFAKNGSFFACTGALVNDKAGDFIPYMLTANHCFDSATSASSLEAVWRYRTTNCFDPNIQPNPANFPRSLGSTLLATSPVTDFTLIRLKQSPPGGSFFLGWSTLDVSKQDGKEVYRISHPEGNTQFFSSHKIVASLPGTCAGRPQGDYLYMRDDVGGTTGGSSGAPSYDSNLMIVGQLFGACGTNLEDDCDRVNNFTLDGAFRNTFNSISQYINVGGGATPGPCVASTTTACVLNGRFKVTVRFRAGFDNSPADSNALVKSVTGFANPNFETAFFYFNSPDNIEVLMKILDQGNTDSQGNPTIAVLFGTATPLRIEVTVVDSQTGATRQYTSQFGEMRGTTDFTAFLR